MANTWCVLVQRTEARLAMSMVQQFYQATDEEIRQLAAGAEDDDALEAFLVRKGKESGLVYIDKAWHGIHFLLTGTNDAGAPPLDFLLGWSTLGTDIGGTSWGWTRAFTSAETKAIADALRDVTPWVLHVRYDPVRMAELDIYPGGWLVEDTGSTVMDAESQRLRNDESRDYLISHFRSLKRFVRKAAKLGHGIIQDES